MTQKYNADFQNHKTWLEIDRKALLYNITAVRRLIDEDVALMAVVKANAYGHGLMEVVQLLSGQETKGATIPQKEVYTSFCPLLTKEGGIRGRFLTLASKLLFGVDSLDEANTLKAEGIKNPIMILGHIPTSRISEALKENFHIPIYSKESFHTIYAEMRKITNGKGVKKITPHFHCKIETGTNRLGLSLDDLRVFPARFPIEGIYTHFAEVENPTSRFYTKQLSVLHKARALLAKKNIIPHFVHSASTAALLQYPETHGNLVRLGIGLYGLWPSEEVKDYLVPTNKLLSPQSQWGMSTSPHTPLLRKEGGRKKRIPLFSGGRFSAINQAITFCPVLTWKTRVAQIKRIKKGETVGYDRAWRARRSSTIAVLPVGYYDGYDRRLSGCGEVLIHGQRAPLVGRVCMNMIMVDITSIAARPDDEVVLLGKSGKEEITADEIAKKIGTINYEIVSRINPLLSRIVV